MIRGERQHPKFVPTESNPLAAVDNGIRLVSVEQRIYVVDGIVRVAPATSEREVARVGLSGAGLEFFIDLVPERDLYHDYLSYARDLARETLWKEAKGR